MKVLNKLDIRRCDKTKAGLKEIDKKQMEESDKDVLHLTEEARLKKWN
jgi:hypothetical protein